MNIYVKKRHSIYAYFDHISLRYISYKLFTITVNLQDSKTKVAETETEYF